MAIIWKKEYKLGFSIIDEQHERFVDTLNKIYSAAYEAGKNDALLEIFEDLCKYINEHFNTEEKYFGEFDYENSEEHKALHREFNAKIEEFKLSYFSDDDKLKIITEIVNFLEDWLFNHLANEDKKYVKCFQKHGLD
jgi:hemerythrin